MRYTVGYPAFSNLHPFDLAKLVLCLLCGDTVDCEAPLGIIDQTKVLASFVYGDNVHEPSGVCSVGPNLAIDLEETLHKDGFGLTIIQGILQSGERVS